MDTTTARGKLIFHLFVSLAEFERAVLRERTRAGLMAARARGRTEGRPRALSESDSAVAKGLLKNPVITVEEIARRLKVAPSTLCRARALPEGRSRASV